MRKPTRLTSTACFTVLILTAQNDTRQKPSAAPVRPVTDEYFGQRIIDPYRYMENLKDPEVQSWMKTQAQYTRATLDGLSGHGKLLADIAKFADSGGGSVSDLTVVGQHLFYLQQPPGANLPRLCERKGLDGAERVLLDPAQLGTAEKHVSIDSFAPSWDAKYVAVDLAAGGSEEEVLHVYNVANGKEIGKPIPRASHIAWLGSKTAFLYTGLPETGERAPAIERFQKAKVYLHKLGEAKEDQAVFGYDVNPNIQIEPAHESVAHTGPSGRYVVVWISGIPGTPRRFFVAPESDLERPGQWKKVADFEDRVWDVTMRGEDLYLVTDHNAPRFKVVKTSASSPDVANAQLTFADGQSVLAGGIGFGALALGGNVVHPAKDGLYITLFDGAASRIVRVSYGAGATAERLALPWIASVYAVASDERESGAYFELTGWSQRGDYYRALPGKRDLQVTGLMPENADANLVDIITEDVEARAEDGTMIPLSIAYKRGLKRDGSGLTLLEGYGASAVIFGPWLGLLNRSWLEHGGIYALAHVRGGGEKGNEWRRAGQISTKPNSWNDFIACAEYLVQHKYTSPVHLAAWGGSAGGITVGRAIEERPDLFAAAFEAAPVSDSLRLELTPFGVSHTEEFGSVKTEEGFRALYAMSPYHHVEDRKRYPAVLISTGINDPRVDPWGPAKLAARLQVASSSNKPVLLRVDYDAGHLIGTANQFFQLVADGISFLFWQLGSPDFQPTRSTMQTSASR